MVLDHGSMSWIVIGRDGPGLVHVCTYLATNVRVGVGVQAFAMSGPDDTKAAQGNSVIHSSPRGICVMKVPPFKDR